MLAAQAAVALDNAQWSQGLEAKVAERTLELSASNAMLEQRANELAIINSVQQGMAGSLDFQAIVDLVGDKVRELFDSADMGIQWLDEQTGLIHFLYAYEHGKRLHLPPMKAPVDRRYYKALVARQTVRWNSHADYPAWELYRGRGNRREPVGCRDPDLRRGPFTRLHRAGELRARQCLRRCRRAPAQHRGRRHGRGAGERAALRRSAEEQCTDIRGARTRNRQQRHPSRHCGFGHRHPARAGRHRPSRGPAFGLGRRDRSGSRRATRCSWPPITATSP